MPVGVARTGSNLPSGNFLPEVWSKKLQAKFYLNTVLSQIANHNWEGEIKGGGSKVNIRVRPTINISDYTVNSTLSYQDLVDGMIELLIDKAKSYAFKVDDIDNAQSDISIVNETTMDAAEQMKIAIDSQVLAAVYADATQAIGLTTVTKANVLDWLVDAGTALDEKNVPETGRYVVLPPWICGMIKKSDLQDASISGDGTSILRNGRVGQIDRFTVYSSNNVNLATTTYNCFAGQKEAITFASQFVKTETVRLQDSFGDAIRGLNVFGFKTVQADALVHMPAAK